jgi:hypothetical protein
MLHTRVVALACVLAVVACGSRTTAGGEGEGSGDDGTTGDDGDDGTTGDGGDDGTTGGDGDDGTTGDDGGTVTGDTGWTGDECPPREEVHAWLTVDLPPEEPFTGECTIESVSENGDEVVVSLSCEGPPLVPVTLTINSDPMLLLDHLEGLNVRLDYAVNMPWWIEQWIVMQTFDPPGTPLLIVDGPTLEPPTGALDHPGLELAEVEGVCPLVPGDCATEERLAIDVTSDAATQRMFDGSVATFGRHDVVVPNAGINHPPINCTDLPSRWITVIAVETGQ